MTMDTKLTTARNWAWGLSATALGVILIMWGMFRADSQDYQAVGALLAMIYVTWSWNRWKNTDEQGDIIADIMEQARVREHMETHAQLTQVQNERAKLARVLAATQEQLAVTVDELQTAQNLATVMLSSNIRHLSTAKGKPDASRNN